MTRRPNMFIIGAPKAGTTSLYAYLEGHPDVHMSPVKEPFYFSPDVSGGVRRRYEFGENEAQYLELFEGAGDQKVVGEASTRYLVSERAAGLVAEFAPDARMVAILRNPIDMMHALHHERVSDGIEDIVDFEEALVADADRRAGRRLRDGANSRWAVYRNHARYGEQLDRWLAAFPREQVHVIVFDDFIGDTAGEFRKMLEFLEIDPDFRPETFEARRRSHRRRGGVVRLVVGNRASRWVAHKVLPRLMGRGSASRMVWNFRQSRVNRVEQERKPLSPAVRSQLEAEFTPDVTHLSELLGRDLRALWFGGA